MMDLALRLLNGDAPHKIPAGAPVRRIKYVEPADDGTDTEQVEQLSYEEALVARRQRLLNALTTHRWLETAYLSGAASVQLDTARRDLHELVRLGLAERRTASSEINKGSTGWWRAVAAGQRMPEPPPKPPKPPKVKAPPAPRMSAAERAERRERVLLALSCSTWRETAEVARIAGLPAAIVYTDLRRLEFARRADAQSGRATGGVSPAVFWRAR